MLKAVYPSKDDIPEGLQTYYKEQADGSFKLELEGGVKTQADVDRVKSALENQRDENEELKRTLSGYPKDFDPDKWEKLKDLDPDNLPKGGKIDPDDEKEFNKRVSEAVREKEREIKANLEEEYETKKQELADQKAAILEKHKTDWIKQKLAEKHGFTDPKRLRWFMLDIQNGELPDLKRSLESIQVIDDEGTPKIVGGDLKDADGALEIIEKVAQKEIVKDYKPASDNAGGGAGNDGKTPVNGEVKKLKKADGTLNLTVASQLYRQNKEKARQQVSAAGFDPDKVFQN